MLSMLKSWQGEVEINGNTYKNIQDATTDFKAFTGNIHIILRSNQCNVNTQVIQGQNQVNIQPNTASTSGQECVITVKSYMTKFATPEFDFMAKFNNDNPMPLRTMTGTIEKETRGMYYMKLHGEVTDTVTCMRCGRTLTNAVSKMYGIGPECIHKVPFFINVDPNEVKYIQDNIKNVEWEGWVIKSAITSMKEVG